MNYWNTDGGDNATPDTSNDAAVAKAIMAIGSGNDDDAVQSDGGEAAAAKEEEQTESDDDTAKKRSKATTAKSRAKPVVAWALPAPGMRRIRHGARATAFVDVCCKDVNDVKQFILTAHSRLTGAGASLAKGQMVRVGRDFAECSVFLPQNASKFIENW
jgi:hypothetical protein